MSIKEEIRANLCSVIGNLDLFIESFSADKIYVIDSEEHQASYLLKAIDYNKNACTIEVRSGQGRDTKTILFDDRKVFTISHSDEIYFIPIDGNRGLLKGGHCDFVFFNEQNYCFVELKLNATSTNEVTIENNRNKAVEQLRNTVNYFNRILSDDYSGLSKIAYVATPDHYPQKDTSLQNIDVLFLEETGCRLRESREHKQKPLSLE